MQSTEPTEPHQQWAISTKFTDNYSQIEVAKVLEDEARQQRLRYSGLNNHKYAKLIFDNYKTTEHWQAKLKTKAEKYCCEEENVWFYIGGQSGAGKTHLCTAMLSYFLTQGKSVKYMPWLSETRKIKAIVNNDFEYYTAVQPLKNVEVLYIDDFFKTQQGKLPTTADILLAFEIINDRYNDEKPTIISSELYLSEVTQIDEAIGGRISELAGVYVENIGLAKEKNYRTA